MCKILPRLKELADNEGITIGALERSIGASKGVISRAINNGTDIQSKWLQAIVENYPQYSAQWLLTGEGDMINSGTSIINPELVKTDPTKGINYTAPFSPVMDNPDGSNSQRWDSHDSASYPLISEKHVVDPYKPFERLINPDTEPEGIPLVSVKAVGGFAGSDFSIQKQDIEAYYVIPKFRNRDVDFLIEVAGDSMMPRIFPGDIIACSIIHNPQFIQWNKTYLISSEEQGMIVKRLKKSHEKDSYLAVSDNPDYEPFDIPKRDIMGLALVVGLIHVD